MSYKNTAHSVPTYLQSTCWRQCSCFRSSEQVQQSK